MHSVCQFEGGYTWSGVLSRFAQVRLAEDLGVGGAVVFIVREGAPLTMTQRQEYGRLWADYVAAMAGFLL